MISKKIFNSWFQISWYFLLAEIFFKKENEKEDDGSGRYVII